MGRVANEALAVTWRQRIARQRRSQSSIAEFCSAEGVSANSFYAWRRRLREGDAAGPRSGLFVPIELPSSGTPAGVRIELPGGAVVILPPEASAELVTAAIGAVLRSASNAERPAC
jgi:transposase